MKRKAIIIATIMLLCCSFAMAQMQMPYIPNGVIDTTIHETVGLKPATDVKTITVFKAIEQSDHYANGVVMVVAGFAKG